MRERERERERDRETERERERETEERETERERERERERGEREGEMVEKELAGPVSKSNAGIRINKTFLALHSFRQFPPDYRCP